MIDITVDKDDIPFTKEHQTLLESVINKAFEYENVKPIDVSVVITDNEEIHKLNKEFRDVDRPTDVLSFPMFDDDGNLDEETLGDIVISFEKAVSQAEEYGHSVTRELGFLTAHSMLHLFGYDHLTDEEREEMFEKQNDILNQLGITREA